MHKIELNYSLTASRSSDNLIRNPLLDLLHAVRSSGSISAAAKVLNLSYRHVWGELKRWETELGHELLIWEKGQSARLSEFGNKLLWAERQAQARLTPQIEALRADLERAFAVAFDDAAHVLTCYASHDEALVQLREHCRRDGQLHLDLRFTGSVDAISALNEGRCVLAGFHTLRQPALRSRSAAAYKPLLRPGLHKIIGFAQRSQGLLVAPGNPHRIHDLQDLRRPGLRYVNRDLGAGTRVLLEELLAQKGLKAADIGALDRTEPSHDAVAQAIASDQADVGLGIAAVAQSRGLDFIPLVTEQYHLVCLKSELDSPAVKALLRQLRTPSWQDELSRIAGYTAERSGEVLAMKSVLPWWNFKAKASPKLRAGSEGTGTEADEKLV